MKIPIFCSPYGKGIKEIYVNEDGDRCTQTRPFKPTIYEHSPVPTKFKDANGYFVAPREVDSIRRYVEQYEHVGNHYYSGDIDAQYQFLNMEYPEDIVADARLIPMMVFDAEMDSSNGFPDAWKAESNVVSITCYLTKKDRIVIFGDKPDYKPHDPRIIYHYCKQELEILEGFWNLFGEDICIVSGWNTMGFDMVFLINRSLALGLDPKPYFPNKYYSKKFDKLLNTEYYNIPGLIQYDYLLLMKKFWLEKFESYSLDYIATHFLGEGKVSYKDHGTIQRMYEEDYQKFIEYNCLPMKSSVWLKDKISHISDVHAGDMLIDSSVVKVFPSSLKKEYHIDTSLGQQIISSGDHIFPIMRKSFRKLNFIDMTAHQIMECKEDLYLIVQKHKNTNTPLTYRKFLIDNLHDLLTYNHFDFCLHDDLCKKHLKSIGQHPGYRQDFVEHPHNWTYKKIGKHFSKEQIVDFLYRNEEIFFVFSGAKFKFNISDVISDDTLYLMGLIYTDGCAIWKKSEEKKKENRVFARYSISNTDVGIISFLSDVVKTTPTIKAYKKYEMVSHGKSYNGNMKDIYAFLLKSGSGAGILFPMIYAKDNIKSINMRLLSTLSTTQFQHVVAGVIDGDGSISLNTKKSATFINFVNYNGDLNKWQELFLWNGYLTNVNKKSNYINILNFGQNLEMVESLRLKHSEKKIKLEAVINFRKKRKLINIGNQKHFRLRDMGEYHLVRICSVTQSENTTEMIDIETTSSYFVTSGIKTHNCKDTMLVVDLEDKIKMIQNAVNLGLMAKVNLDDVFSPVRIWDAIVYQRLLKENIIVPRKYEYEHTEYAGAFVKEPERGLHEWVTSFDINSLYPNILISWNMSKYNLIPDSKLSPELLEIKNKLKPKNKEENSVHALLENKIDLSVIKKYNYSLSASGQFFDNTRQDPTAKAVEEIFNERMELKYKLKKLDETSDEYAIADNRLWVLKILINSFYGAYANQYFRHYSREVAESITLTGQYIIQKIADVIDGQMQKLSKNPQEKSVIYIDTDSNYLQMASVIKKYFEQMKIENPTRTQIVEAINKITDKAIFPCIKKTTEEIHDQFNSFKNNIFMAKEKICEAMIFIEKKKYLMYSVDERNPEKKSKVSVKGVEIVRTSTPGVIRKKMKDTVEFIFETRSENQVRNLIKEFKKEEFSRYTMEEIAFPRGVSDITKYRKSKKAWDYTDGCPMHVRAAILYNKLIERNGLTMKYPIIKDGEKIRFIYLDPRNPIHENVIGFPAGFKLPPEFGLHKYIDVETQFRKTYLDPIISITDKIGWSIDPSLKGRRELF